jgi:hypothetical protein
MSWLEAGSSPVPPRLVLRGWLRVGRGSGKCGRLFLSAVYCNCGPPRTLADAALVLVGLQRPLQQLPGCCILLACVAYDASRLLFGVVLSHHYDSTHHPTCCPPSATKPPLLSMCLVMCGPHLSQTCMTCMDMLWLLDHVVQAEALLL